VCSLPWQTEQSTFMAECLLSFQSETMPGETVEWQVTHWLAVAVAGRSRNSKTPRKLRGSMTVLPEKWLDCAHGGGGRVELILGN
jgi:hypothetical protein